MREPLAIRLQNVSKIYKLHGSQSDQLIDVLGLQRFGIKTKTPFKEFSALSDISLKVPRGHRIGIVGRNGAGKTTLLKLICGNFTPTSGAVEVNGTVQALMNIGLGFHPEYTGRENVEASLQYNGLARDEYKNAMEGIIDFCELGDFLDQPFKTYSLGMQARLMFAAATAIRPDILIVDEVLGAGDAYFVAKSKSRVEKLVSSGCTMLLVSHSMQQVLELCDEVIWLDNGAIRMQGEAFLVVKAYEEYLYGPINKISQEVSPDHPILEAALQDTKQTSVSANVSNRRKPQSRKKDEISVLLLQEPRFCPHIETAVFPTVAAPGELKFTAPGGVSRWEANEGLKICGFTIVTEQGETNKLVVMRPAKFLISVIAQCGGDYECRYGILFFDYMGSCVARIVSPLDKFSISKNCVRHIEMILNPNQLGAGEYILSVSVHKFGSLEVFNSTARYDLINRGFQMQVEMPDSLAALSANFYHTAEWSFHLNQGPEK
jgi:lipopolysaccharide transport system ATP-binding protein